MRNYEKHTQILWRENHKVYEKIYMGEWLNVSHYHEETKIILSIKSKS